MELDRRLTEVLSEFARTLVTDFPIQGILDHLVQRIVEVLPITAAGVTLISPSLDPRYLAASDPAALRFEQLQTELGEGPCIEAYVTGGAVAVADLRRDGRFPQFAARAAEAGLGAVFTFPLRQGERQLGALDLYRTTPGALDARAMIAAQTLADVAAAYLQNAQARADLLESSDRAMESSLHDGLTGLPNRTLLVQRLEHAILRSRRSGGLVAILFADLDRFKEVNDTYGHHTGDELLVEVASRLSGLLRPGDTLARLAGDEFVVLCEDLDEASQVEVVAARIDAALGEPFVLASAVVHVSASVGIAFAGRGNDVPELVLQDADTAMYQVKRGGGARHGIVDLREAQRGEPRAGLGHDLRRALSSGQVSVAYQPIVSTTEGRVASGEALLRWTHPRLGPIDPDVAVPLAEQSGQIAEIGRWVLDRACRDRHAWPASGEGIGVAVNVSGHQLMSADFARSVADALDTTGTEPSLLTLEVTENVFIQDTRRALVVLDELKHTGVRLALDDFGTGFASLSHLKAFPIDVVKIDQSFVVDLVDDPDSRVIVAAVVGLAHGLDMTVVAEGVETAAQHEQVAALGCDFEQGFYSAEPSPTDAFAEWLTGARSSAEEPRGPAPVTDVRDRARRRPASRRRSR